MHIKSLIRPWVLREDSIWSNCLGWKSNLICGFWFKVTYNWFNFYELYGYFPKTFLHISPLQSCPPWVCMPAAGQTSSGLPPGWNLLWSSGKGPWCCCSGCTQSSAPSQPSTHINEPENKTNEVQCTVTSCNSSFQKGACDAFYKLDWHFRSTTAFTLVSLFLCECEVLSTVC